MAKQKKTAQYKNNQLEKEFDKLRRQGRRRLVIAVILVIVTAVVLIQILNKSDKPTEAELNIEATHQSDDEAATGGWLLEPVDDDVASQPDASVGGVGEMPHHEAISSEVNDIGVIYEPIVEGIPPAKTQVDKQVDKQNEDPVPSISINQKNISQQDKKPSSSQQNQQSSEAAKPSSSSPKQTSPKIEKSQDNKNSPTTSSSTTSSQSSNKTTTPPKSDSKNTNKDKLSPQDILNGKTTSKPATQKNLSPQEILNGKTTQGKSATSNQSKSGKVVIQVAALSSEEKANVVKQQLSQAGVNAFLVKSETTQGQIIRVRVGPYNDRAQAEKVLALINQQGHQGIIVSQ